jgi:hypothetical protein
MAKTMPDETEERPESIDGRMWGYDGPTQDGAVETQLVPDDASPMQSEVLEYAIKNPSRESPAEVHRGLVQDRYDGDEDPAPSYKTVWATLDQYERPTADGRKQPTTAETEDDSDETDTIHTEVGNVSYDGPAKSLDDVDSEELAEEVGLFDNEVAVPILVPAEPPVMRSAREDLTEQQLLDVVEALVEYGADRELLRYFAGLVESET